MPTDILYADRYGDAHIISGLKSAIRESAADDPQPEGIVVDQKQNTLYIGFETIGLYKIALTPDLPLLVLVGPEHLLEPVYIFGQSYWAIPDNDEFACVYNPDGEPAPVTIVAAGRKRFGGQHLVADLEGLTLYYAGPGTGYLISNGTEIKSGSDVV